LAGGVHDYLSGMISVKFNGKSIIYITEKLFGKKIKLLFLIFFSLLLLLIGVVFATNPAKMLADISNTPFIYWVVAIFLYYFLATFLPVDKIIGKFYPFFAALLIVMTILTIVVLLLSKPILYPNLTFANLHPLNLNVFPMLFITVACGAISGFHATQSPIMAKCISYEKQGRIVFYGAMITEGIIALIWATLGIAFYNETGGLLNAINNLGQGGVVSEIATSLLGKFGGVLTVLSVIVLSLTSGDTAFRSLRLTIAENFNIDQKKISKRLFLSFIILFCGILLAKIDLTVLWQYFGWANQMLATFVLWVLSSYLSKKKKFFFITFLPALFMTAVCISYILQVKIGFSLAPNIANLIGILISLLSGFFFIFKITKK